MEIKTAVHSQRVRGAGSRIERRQLNGPLRARSKAFCSVHRDVRHTSVAGDMLVFRKARRISANQGGTAGGFSPVLDRDCRGRDFLFV